MSMRTSSIKQRGDTIVEVMIVLAVLGFAISVSYATANRSLLNARQAQENSEATEFVQSQVEALNFLAQNSPTDPADPSMPNPNYIYQTAFQTTLFCVDNANHIATTGFTTNDPLTTVYPAVCQRGTDSRYHLSVSYGGAASNDTFTVRAIWNDVRDEDLDSVTLVYRVHEN